MKTGNNRLYGAESVMQSRTQDVAVIRLIRSVCLLVVLALGFVSPASAMESLTDGDLSGVSGEGLAFVLENIKAQMAPTSYIEEVGSYNCFIVAAPNCSTAPATSLTTLQRGDLYWFGWSITQDATGQAWAGTCSTATAESGLLGCPIGGTNASSGFISNLAAFDNPYLLRVFTYQGWDAKNVSSTSANTVLEILGPSCVNSGSPPTTAGCAGPGSAGSTQLPMDSFRWSFWGAISVTRTSSTNTGDATGTNWTVPSSSGILKSQTIIEGVPAAYLYPVSIATTSGVAGTKPNMYQGSVLQLFRTLADSGGVDDLTLGLVYNNTLSGNFRFSVNQDTVTDADSALATVPQFDDKEGMFFRNVQAFLPLGQLNYQSIVFNTGGTAASHPAGAGNFVIELSRLPTAASCSVVASPTACAYGDFYSLENTGVANAALTAVGPGAEKNACTAGAPASAQCGYYTAFDAQTTVAVSATANWTNVPYNYWQTHGYIEWGLGNIMNVTVPYSGGAIRKVPGVTSDSGVGINLGVGGAATDCSTTTAKCTNVSDGIYFVSGTDASTSTRDTFTAAADTDRGYPTGTGDTNKVSWDPNVTNIKYSTAGLNVVNIGTSYIDGFALQHLKITTLGGK
jgi:hypothetical protein